MLNEFPGVYEVFYIEGKEVIYVEFQALHKRFNGKR